MLNVVITGHELFNPRCRERKLQEGLEGASLSSRVEEIVSKAGVIRQSHIDGHPNHSHLSSTNGASEAAQRLTKNQDRFVRDDDKWFGQNAQETWYSIKKLWGK